VLARLALLGLLLAGSAACGGSSCADLPRLTAERDAARARWTAVTASGPASEADRAHDEMHALDQQVYALDQEC
jgi:hypothetical protein